MGFGNWLLSAGVTITTYKIALQLVQVKSAQLGLISSDENASLSNISLQRIARVNLIKT